MSDICVYTPFYFSLTYLRADQPEREMGWMPSVLPVWVPGTSIAVDVYGWLCIHVLNTHVCTHGKYAQSCYWLDLWTWSCSNCTFIKLIFGPPCNRKVAIPIKWEEEKALKKEEPHKKFEKWFWSQESWVPLKQHKIPSTPSKEIINDSRKKTSYKNIQSPPHQKSNNHKSHV